MTSLFLSYARGDDEPFVRRLHADLTTRGFDVWFDRVSMPSRNLTFHQEIRDAIAARERLVLVVGPRAVTSDYVRQEWQFAWREADKIVTPILRLGDYALVPDELRLLHSEDFRTDAEYTAHLQKLVQQLRETAPRLGKLIAIPSLPAYYLQRTDRHQALRDALRADLDRPVVIGGVAARVGMHGMGGIGKTVLAAALARDRSVREAFPDGIIWVGMGSSPDIRALIQRVHRDLGGDGEVASEHEGKQRLRELLAEKAALLVLDDVWRRADVDAFDVLGARCRALVTTRDTGLLTALGGAHHVIDLLTDRESRYLLATVVGVMEDKLPDEAANVIAECGRLPLAVALCGSLVRRGMPWSGVLEQLQKARIDRISDRHAVEVHHQSVWHAIHVSVEALGLAERERFLELRAFTANEPFSEAAVATLWGHTGQLDAWSTAELLSTLAERSLLQTTISTPSTATSQRRFSLHDLVYDYAQRELPDCRHVHQKMLAAYARKCPEGWPSGPDDGYYLTHLRQHLTGAGRVEELADLLLELRWLEAKNLAGVTFDLAADFRDVLSALSDDDPRHGVLQLLDEALRRDLHFIARHRTDYPQALFQCLWNSGWWHHSGNESQLTTPCQREPDKTSQSLWHRLKTWVLGSSQPMEGRLLATSRENRTQLSLRSLLEQWRLQKEEGTPGFVWLRSLYPPTPPLGTAQLGVLVGHEGAATCVAYSPDDSRIASGGGDGTLRVWDTGTGQQLACLHGHKHAINRVMWTRDRRQIVTTEHDGTVRTWDAERYSELSCLSISDFVDTAAFSGPYSTDYPRITFDLDGQPLVAWYRYWPVFAWDGRQAQELDRWKLDGGAHTIQGIELLGDRLYAFIEGAHERIHLFDMTLKQQVCTLVGHKGSDNVFKLSSDAKRIVSGGWDGTVRVWDAESGSQLACWQGNDRGGNVSSVAFFPDNQRVVSGAGDGTVRIWNPDGTKELACFRAHRSSVTSVACSSCGKSVVSAGADGTVRIWDVQWRSGLPQSNSLDTSFRSGIAYSADGLRVVTLASDRTIVLQDAQSRRELACLRGHEGLVMDVAFTVDGRWGVSLSTDDTVRVWDVRASLATTCLRGVGNTTRCVAISTDGRQIATGGVRDGTVRIWDAERGAEVARCQWHAGAPLPDLPSYYLQQIEPWYTAVECVAFSYFGQFVVSGGEDQTVRVWDARTGRELACLLGHAGPVINVAFSDDDRRVVSASTDQTVRVWDTHSGRCLDTLPGNWDLRVVGIKKWPYPQRACARAMETVIEATNTRRPIAWFPVALSSFAAAPSGDTWGGNSGNSLVLFTLEGDWLS